MPIIQVYALEGRTVEQKRKLARALTEGICATFDVAPEDVQVLILDVARDDWATTGVLASDRDRT